MDNDAAHHAVIALRMHLTGDFVNLVDQGRDYLDKPHLHFWLSAVSFDIFGINGFAYKFPSFLFAVAGVFSVYKLGERLYSKDTGRLAALMLASSFGYLLSVSDVRMDAILVSCIAFSSWQLTSLEQDGKIWQVLGAALGLAMGFSTKGHIAVFIPLLLTFFLLIWKKDLRRLLSWKWVLLLLLFFIFISPVLYCYYLQFNLHPEKTVRGQSGINGVKFILWDQVIDRLEGKMENQSFYDPFFFLHSFLPAFAPWSLLAYIAVGDRLKKMAKPKWEFATALLFLSALLLVTISRYQLPHYLNVIFPAAAVLTSGFFVFHPLTGKWLQALTIMQMIVSFIILAAAAVLNAWCFPVNDIVVVLGVILLLALVFYFIKSKQYVLRQKAVLVSASTMIFFFFLMNVNFYPSLLEYQGGKLLAKSAKDHRIKNVYVWENTYSSSFHFYSGEFRQLFQDSVLNSKTKVWLLFDQSEEETIRTRYQVGDTVFSVYDFEVTRLTLKFLDPHKRKGELTRLVLASISRK